MGNSDFTDLFLSRNFLQTMATFNKPLVAAIHGDMVGLGVTMLPLFDVVIAQDSSTFQTPYGILGHLPEAMKIFTSTKNLKPRAVNIFVKFMFITPRSSTSFCHYR